MRRAILLLAIALMGNCMGGCAISMGVWKEDVTHDSRFQSGYQAGQVYKLTSEGSVLALHEAGTNDQEQQLFPAENATTLLNSKQLAAFSYTQTAAAPRGTLVRIDRLIYTDDVFLFGDFNLGGSMIHPNQGLRVLATVTTPSAQWHDVRIMARGIWFTEHSGPAPVWSTTPRVSIPRPDLSFLRPAVDGTRAVPPK